MKLEKVKDVVVNIPSHIIMSDETINLHKISNEEAHNSSITIEEILREFIEDIHCNSITAIVGHNISFDINPMEVVLSH